MKKLVTISRKNIPALKSFMLTPRLGDDVRPLLAASNFFPYIIAFLFCSFGMIPKDHPAFHNPNIFRFALSEVFHYGFKSISWSYLGIGRACVLLFAGITIFLVTFAFVLFAVSLFISPAPAAESTGIFSLSTTSTQCDLGYRFIDYLFFGKDIGGGCPLNSFELPHSNAIQEAIGGALGFYSNAMLVFGGILLFYLLVYMIAETAHTGKPMGQANQIWAPIRLVLAIGLLVPVGSSGFNSGQYIVIQSAKWGSALASNVWAGMITKINSNEGLGGLALTMPPPKELTATVKNMTQTMVALGSTYTIKQGTSAIQKLGKTPTRAPKPSFDTGGKSKKTAHVDLPQKEEGG